MKLGKKLGFVAWKMTGNENVERALKKIVLTPGPGRYVFNKIKRDPAKQPSRLVIEPTTRNV